MVNFHALARYFKNANGDAALQRSRKGIKTAVFSSGFKLSDLPELALTIEEQLEGVSPGDYFLLHTRMSEAFHECNLTTLAAHMQFTHWDPHMYLKLSNHIISKIENEDNETIQFMAASMPTMAKNYYYLPKTPCVLFDIGIFYHAIKKYEEAADYYQQALPFVDEQYGLHYNLALCQYHVGKNEHALINFKKAFEMDSNSKEAEQWISFLETQDADKE
jgi:tetratricopeptide (TPR) repeat protein